MAHGEPTTHYCDQKWYHQTDRHTLGLKANMQAIRSKLQPVSGLDMHKPNVMRALRNTKHYGQTVLAKTLTSHALIDNNGPRLIKSQALLSDTFYYNAAHGALWV